MRMKLNRVETPPEFMLELDWDIDTLDNAIKFLESWDNRRDDFYQNHKKIHKDFDEVEREHYRNCVNFWKKKLNYENKPS